MGEERIWSLASQITEEEGISGYCYPEGFKHSGKTTSYVKLLTYALKIRVQTYSRCHFPKHWVSISLWFSYSVRIPWKPRGIFLVHKRKQNQKSNNHTTTKTNNTIKHQWEPSREGLVSWFTKFKWQKTKKRFWKIASGIMVTLLGLTRQSVFYHLHALID